MKKNILVKMAVLVGIGALLIDAAFWFTIYRVLTIIKVGD